MAFTSYTIYNSYSSGNGSSVASSSTHTAFTPFFLQARAICPLVLQLRHVAFLNLHFDRTWPAFPNENKRTNSTEEAKASLEGYLGVKEEVHENFHQRTANSRILGNGIDR